MFFRQHTLMDIKYYLFVAGVFSSYIFCSLFVPRTFLLVVMSSPRLLLDPKGHQTPMTGLRRSSASSDDDSLVAFSNEEAAWGKYSSVKAGLYGDPLVGLFMRPPEETKQMVVKPQPEIQRGYYIREVIVRLAVKDFIEAYPFLSFIFLSSSFFLL